MGPEVGQRTSGPPDISPSALKPVGAVGPATNLIAKSRPNRNALATPSALMKSRCIALRGVCAFDARGATGIQTPQTAIANRRSPLYRA